MNSRTFLVAFLMACGTALAAPQPPMNEEPKPAPERSAQPAAVTARMQEVLDELAALKPKAIETLTPKEARRQPTMADAAKEWLKHHKNLSLPKTPEPVADIDNKKYTRGEGATNPAGTAGVIKGREQIRIYTPMAAKGAPKEQLWPVVVYWHGGGFVIADIDTYDASCRALANAAGCIVASADYRQAPEDPFPAAADDAVAAYRWVLAHAKEFGGDPANVSVAGESAGGNLAAVVCLAAKAQGFEMPKRQVLIYPVTQDSLQTDSAVMYADAKPLNRAMMSWFFGHYGQKGAEKSLERSGDAPPPPRFDAQSYKPLANPDWRMFPLRAADHAGLPPATIILAEVDPLASDGAMYAEKLQSAGVPVQLRKFPGVTHEFFGLTAILPESRDAVAFAAEGLKGTQASAPTR